MSTPTYIFHDSGVDVCQQDTLVIYLKDEGIDRADGHEVFKLGKSRDSKSNGLSAVERARGRYQGKGFFDACLTFNLSKVCELMGVPYTPALLANPAQDPKFDDWLRARLLKPWKSASHLRGKVKTNDAGVEELLGHKRELRQELVKAIAEICGFAKKSPKPLFQLYAYQRPVAQLLMAALLKWEKALMQCFGGYGKSATALDLAVRLYKGRGYALILSPVKVTIQDFKTTALKFKFGEQQLEANVRELKDIKSEAQFLKWIAQCEAAGMVPVVIDTVQSARGKDKADAEDFEDVFDEKEREKLEKELRKLDKRYAFLKAAECFLLMRDETHLHFAADQTSQVLAKLKPKYTLDMTATITARENAAFKYENEAVVTFGLLEALLAKRDGTDPILARLPNLELMACTHLELPKECQTELRAEANINGQKVFDFKKGRLTYPTTALEVIDMTFSLGAYGTGVKPEWKACTLGREVTQTGTAMLIVPRGGKEGGAREKIDFIVKLINTRRGDQALVISSYEFDHRLAIAGITKTSKDVLEDLRKEAGSRKLIIVTHHKLLTGVNLPALEGIALWDKIGSQALFMQTEYRLFREYEDELFGLKKTTKMVVYEPGVAIHDSSALQAMSAELRDGAARTSRPVKEIEHLFGLSVYTNAGLREVTHVEMEAAYQAQLRAKELELYEEATDPAVRGALGDEGLEAVYTHDVVGQGANKGSGIDATGVSDDNGAKTTKPGEPAKKAEKEREEQRRRQLEVLCAMLRQLKLFAAHDSVTNKLDALEVAKSEVLRGCWGDVNQQLLIFALAQGTLLDWANNHLRLVLNGIKDPLLEMVGTLGPKQPKEGQQQIILDNATVTDLVGRVRITPKTVLAVNPKSGALVRALQKRWPSVKIWAVSENSVFDRQLQELDVTTLQVDEDGRCSTMDDMKFDLVIGNPPYKRSMHLEFLKLGLDHLAENGELVFVHPAEWLVQKRDTRNQRAIYKPLRDRLSAKQVDITLVDNPWPQVGLYVPLTVTLIGPGEGATLTDTRTQAYGGTKLTPKPTIKLDTLDEATQWGSPKQVASFLTKVWSHPERWHNKARNGSGAWYVNLSGITGNGKTVIDDYDGTKRAVYNMWSLVNSTSLEITDKPQVAKPQAGKAEGNEKVWVPFSTKEEAQHALDFLTRTRFMKALMAICKIDQHVWSGKLLDAVPWLDWTQEWNDAKLASFFNLSAEELATIDEIVDTITL